LSAKIPFRTPHPETLFTLQVVGVKPDAKLNKPHEITTRLNHARGARNETKYGALLFCAVKEEKKRYEAAYRQAVGF
jgi:hypothetical protein